MRLFSWNVNGLRSVEGKQALQDFISKFDPDIFCMQEIKISEDQVAKLELGKKFSQYHQFYNPAEKAGYSGTAIWTKAQPISTSCDIPKEISDRYDLTDQFGSVLNEGRFLVAEFESFYLVNIYSPHTKRELERLKLKQSWNDMLIEVLKRFAELKPVIACGDFNVAHKDIDLANPKPNEFNAGFTKEERQGFTDLLDAGFTDTFRKLNPTKTGAYTWWTWRANARARNIGWRIDYFVVSNSIRKSVTQASIHPDVIGSDHCPVELDINLN